MSNFFHKNEVSHMENFGLWSLLSFTIIKKKNSNCSLCQIPSEQLLSSADNRITTTPHVNMKANKIVVVVVSFYTYFCIGRVAALVEP